MIRQDRVNRPARGLLDLFRAKVGGKGPDTFSQTIQPVIDQAAFLQSNEMKTARTATTITAATSIAIAVPQSETWIIHNICAGWLQGAATSISANGIVGVLKIINLPNGVGTITNVELGGYGWFATRINGNAQVTGNEPSYTWNPGRTFLLPPGAGIRNEMILKNGGDSGDIFISVLYTPLLV